MAGSRDDEMNMCWTVGVPSLALEHIPDWTVIGNGVGSRYGAEYVKVSASICPHASTTRERGFVFLDIVKSSIIGMPYIDDRISNWHTLEIPHTAGNKQWRPLFGTADHCAIGDFGGMCDMKGTEHGRLGGAAGQPMTDSRMNSCRVALHI